MFDTLHNFIHEYTIIIPFVALIVATILKGFFHSIQGKFSFARMFGSGGMPSAHSTFVIALATAMGIKYGPLSDYFMICLVFAIIIIYDATNLRFQAGLHARALNKLPHDGEELNESMWHTPFEAFMGGLIWFLTAVILLGI